MRGLSNIYRGTAHPSSGQSNLPSHAHEPLPVHCAVAARVAPQLRPDVVERRVVLVLLHDLPLGRVAYLLCNPQGAGSDFTVGMASLQQVSGLHPPSRQG